MTAQLIGFHPPTGQEVLQVDRSGRVKTAGRHASSTGPGRATTEFQRQLGQGP